MHALEDELDAAIEALIRKGKASLLSVCKGAARRARRAERALAASSRRRSDNRRLTAMRDRREAEDARRREQEEEDVLEVALAEASAWARNEGERQAVREAARGYRQS